MGLPERPIAGFTLRNVDIQAKRGLLVRNAAVTTAKTTVASADGKAFRVEAGGSVK